MMRITAGMGSLDEYMDFVRAGADEVFCGYVPEKWTRRYGLATPLNRREARYVNVQLGSASELEILSEMRETARVPVALTFNALTYRPEQYALIAEIMEDCAHLGFSTFIVADPALMVYLRGQGLRYTLHVSGEIGEMNGETVELMAELGARRMIFHRKMAISDMARCAARRPDMEYEAFALNEMCHFHGGFCNSLHCDELEHICRLPWRLGRVRGDGEASAPPETAFGDGIGAGGCGLCAFYDLRAAGVSTLKIVGRGNPESMPRDIAAARRALELLEESASRGEFVRAMKAALFPGGCSGNCYYGAEELTGTPAGCTMNAKKTGSADAAQNAEKVRMDLCF